MEWTRHKTFNTFLLVILLLVSHVVLSISQPVSLTRVCLDRSDSTFTLFWNPQTDACNSFERYLIYGQEDDLSPFVLIDEVLTQSNEYSFKAPNLKEWRFFIITQYGCDGVTRYFSDTLKVDTEQPQVWDLDSVSVNPFTNSVQVGWSEHPEPDKKGYYLYHVAANNTLIHDTTGNYFEDSIVGEPFLRSERYALATYDSCMNTAPISTGHTTLFLTGALDTCGKLIDIQWNRYEPVENETYYIVLSVEGEEGPYTIIDSVPFSDPLSYRLPNLDPNTSYCLWVQMRSASFSSTSNRICFTTPPTISAPNHLFNVTVTENAWIKVVFTSELNEGFLDFHKSSDEGQTFSKLQQYSCTDDNPVWTFIDSQVLVHAQSYTYMLTHSDLCNNSIETDTGVQVSSIFLEVVEEEDFSELFWNPYNGFLLNIQEYQIFKMVNPQITPRSTWNFNGLTNPNSTYYLDRYGEDEFAFSVCYVVRALEEAFNSFNRLDTAYSNSVCFLRELSVYFPNAFAPMGLNHIFRPVGVGIDPNESYMEIYNRWGEKIFRTQNILQGWDGTLPNGKLCPPGTYFYNAKIKGDLGAEKEFKGTVNLIH